MSDYSQMLALAQQQSSAARALATTNNAFNSKEAALQRNFEKSLFNVGNQFNAQEAQKSREWQELMSDTAHAREVKDLQAAGLNPILSANKGASTPVGATADSLSAPAGAHATADTSANQAIASVMASLMGYKSNTDAMKTSAESAQRIAEIQAQTSRYVADRSAQASMFNASLNASTQRMINAESLAHASSEAEKAYIRNMDIKAYERESASIARDQELYNQEYMAQNYPSNAFTAAAAAGKNYANITENTRNKYSGFYSDPMRFLAPVGTFVKHLFSKK